MSGLKQIRAIVLGDGQLRHTLLEFARSMGVERQIRFVGLKKNPYAYMARADAFVLCSRYEGLPNAMLEALACGIAVIATPAPGGIAEIAEVTGGVQLASAVSAEALAIEFQRFVENKPNNSGLALERFKVERIAQEYSRVLLA
jgi:glycosyltransferase involved in cell wall biosynthesis